MALSGLGIVWPTLEELLIKLISIRLGFPSQDVFLEPSGARAAILPLCKVCDARV